MRADPNGSAITLETSESLFDIAVALNACGYDNDLENSAPVRKVIRQEINDELAAPPSPPATHRDSLCTYHPRAPALCRPRPIGLAQYVSLALYTLPPPSLTPSVGEDRVCPPDSTQVVGILPLLRTFNEQVHLHALWVQHLPDYQAITDHVFTTRSAAMVLNTNIYLRLPVSSYDGRRFLVMVEPMLAPAATNARIYAEDYIVVGSPNTAGTIHMDGPRPPHLSALHGRAPHLRPSRRHGPPPAVCSSPCSEAPHRVHPTAPTSSAYITECLIKAASRAQHHGPSTSQARAPLQPRAHRSRSSSTATSAATSAKPKPSAATASPSPCARAGPWSGYFYSRSSSAAMDTAPSASRTNIGEMVYGMDVDRERKHEESIAFLPPSDTTNIRRTPVAVTGIKLAELKLMKGDLEGADDIASKILDDPKGDHAEAEYVLGQVSLLQKFPEDAITHFDAAVAGSKNPRTLAWSHIYLGRLYDLQPDRPRAINEYKLALTVRDPAPDSKAAAEKGIKTPFSTPKRATTPTPEDDDNAPLDPSGKAAKAAYKPDQN